MKFIKLISLVVLLGFSPVAYSQIEGFVYGVDNGQNTSLPQANVYWEGTTSGVTTNEKGYFTIERVPDASTLVASFVGYKDEKKIIISRKGKTDFYLMPQSEIIDGVTITERGKATTVDAKSATFKTIIGEQELRKAACCNLSESFETNASVDVAYTDAITGTKQIEMLGLAGKYALLQRENVPFGRGLAANSSLHFIPGPFISSIQVTKGLSSVMNGYESLTGQINVEIHKPETAPKFYLNAFASQGARGELNVLHTQQLSEKYANTLMLHASAIPVAQDMNGDGFADIPLTQQLNLSNRTHYKGTNGWEGQLGVSLISDQKEGGQLSFINDNESAPLAWGFEDKTQRAEVFAKTGYIFKNSVARSLGFIYSANYQTKQANFGTKNYQGEQASFYFNSIFSDIIGTTSHKYLTGISFQADAISEVLNVAEGSNLYDHQRNEIVPGAYFEYTWAPNPKTTLLLGARADYNSYFDELYFTPRLHFRYAITELSTLRLSAGRGQRTPNYIAENYNVLASNRQLNFNSPVAPEIAWNSGISLDQIIPVGEKQIRLTTDAFYTYFENKQVTDLDFSALEAYFLNTEGSESLSIMAQADYTWFKGFETRLAYKYLRAFDQYLNSKNWSYQIPRHRAFANVAYVTESEWKFDATLNWFGRKRLPSTFTSAEVFKQREFSPSFFTLNTQVNKSYKKIEAFIGVNNLLNFRQNTPIVNAQNPFAPYFDSNFTWGPIFGRMVYAGINFKLDQKD